MKKNDALIFLLTGILFFGAIFIFSILGSIVFKAFSNNTVYLIYVLSCIGIVLIDAAILLYINYRDIKLVDKKLEKEYRDNNGIEYYRDKIKNYSPGVLAYCNSKIIDYKKVFIATILDLSRRKYIDIADGNITILNKNYDDLDENERIIIEAIENKRLPETYKKIKKNYISSIKRDAIKRFIIAKIKNYDKYFKMSDICIVIFVIFAIGMAFLDLFGTPKGEDALKGILTYFGAFLMTFILAFCQSIFFKHAYQKTDKGIDLSVKVKCLRRFISEFTDLKNQTISSIKIWDEYIVYALLLDVDGKINKDVNSFYDKYLK